MAINRFDMFKLVVSATIPNNRFDGIGPKLVASRFVCNLMDRHYGFSKSFDRYIIDLDKFGCKINHNKWKTIERKITKK